MYAAISKVQTKSLIFAACGEEVEFLADLFSKRTGIQSFALHGSMEPKKRVETLRNFKSATRAFLFTTDVLARGVDLRNIEVVVQYDAPFSMDDYVHRIGRTARAGRIGRSLLFLLPNEESYLDMLKERRSIELSTRSYQDILQECFDGDWAAASAAWHTESENYIQENNLEQASLAFRNFIRAYSTHDRTERSSFDMRQLHMGHLAKSFCLRMTPSGVSKIGRGKGKEEGGASLDAKVVMAKKARKLASDVSEFNLG